MISSCSPNNKIQRHGDKVSEEEPNLIMVDIEK